MTLACLREDALTSTTDGARLLLSLPWIRSLPLWSVHDLEVRIDGVTASDLHCVLDDRVVPLTELIDEQGWWFPQDRLPILVGEGLAPGAHEVDVSFRLTVPYLAVGPGPLALPFGETRTLTLDAAPAPVPAIVTERTTAPEASTPWTLTASAFNWTPEINRARQAAPDIAVGIVADGIADGIEIEPGQLWRSFPEPTDAEADALRQRLAAVGGSVSIVGASLDDWSAPSVQRSEDERCAFLLPQLRAAHRVGAHGVRLAIGQAGPALLERVLPVLHELDLTLYEEVQGQQTTSSSAPAAAYETIAAIDDPRVRVLVDISMLMPALPVSYLEALAAGGAPAGLVDRLRTEWRDPATQEAVFGLLRTGGVPPHLHALYMDMIVRFGRSDAADLRAVLPMVGAFHLKFWDLDDTDGRISQPIRELGAELAGTGFAGTMCSEWGGHEWLTADAADMTRQHLALAREALTEPQPSRL